MSLSDCFHLQQDEKEIQKTAIKQHRVLRTATEFRYGYKLVVMLCFLLFINFEFFETTGKKGFLFFLFLPFIMFALYIQENGNMRAALSTSDVIEVSYTTTLTPYNV